MRLVKFVIYLAVLIVLGAILIDFLESAQPPPPPRQSNSMSWIPYPEQNLTRVNVTIDDVYAVGLSREFEVLNYTYSPYVLREGGALPFRDAVLEALSRNASEITPEQYFYAADLAGFLKLEKLNRTAEYYIINPTEPFVLRVEEALPSNVNVTYPPSAEIVSVEHLGVGRFRVHFRGYHGEGAVKLIAVCSGVKIQKILHKSGWSWKGDLNISLSVDTSNCAGKTEYRCTLYVEDDLVLNLDRKYVIHRSFKAGSLHYVYEAACRWRECDTDCTTVCDQSGCSRECHTHCWWECGPCSPREHYSWSSAKAPEWAKQELTYRIYRVVKWDRADPAEIYTVKSGGVCAILTGSDLRKGVAVPGETAAIFLGQMGVDRLKKVAEVKAVETCGKPAAVLKNSAAEPISLAGEEYLLRAYADAIANVTSPVIERTLSKIEAEGLWNLYFGGLGWKSAERLLRYFYLVQIPLGIRPDDEVNATRLEAIFEKRANRSVIAGLYTLVENATYVNATTLKIPIVTHFGSRGVKETNTIFALIGREQKFTRDYVESDCGDIAVAELAYYRQPALQSFQKVLREGFESTYGYLPDKLIMRKGYSPGYGVIYRTDEKMCRIQLS